MRSLFAMCLCAGFAVPAHGQDARLVVNPKAFATLVNPDCSHCVDEAKRRAKELRDDDRVLCWLRGYSDGGAIPHRFFLNPYRVISDTYGVFVYDPDAGFARGFAPSLDFAFHGWRNGVMVMRHKDGTLYSCLSGVAFEGPKKGERLTPVPTLTSTWGRWMKTYPHAVAYRMFEKYQPVELPVKPHPDAVKSRGPADSRLLAESLVLGVAVGDRAKAYPLEVIAKAGLLRDTVAGKSVVVLWDEPTRCAVAYEPVAAPPKKGPAPRRLTIERAAQSEKSDPLAPFLDKETGSRWDIAGRAVDGELKGWTLQWLDGTQVKWFAWAAEHPTTALLDEKSATNKPSAKTAKPKSKVNDRIKEVAGTAEFLRNIPKKFGVLQDADVEQRRVTILFDGDKAPTDWQITPDAELKVRGWWGRLEQFPKGERVWAWFTINRSKQPRSIFMLADSASEQEIHGLADPKVAKKLDLAKLEQQRGQQRDWLRQRWLKDGLPGTIGFLHVYSGETDVLLDHEAMRWARTLNSGDKVELGGVKAVVKDVAAQREKTQVRLVVHSLDLADLATGQRVHLKMQAPPADIETAQLPPDIDRPKTKEERIDWFLANMYCTCLVAGDICTGHFYTLASCNPNGCGLPNFTRQQIGEMIDEGKTNRQIFQQLFELRGEGMIRPHLLK
jgi:hypothetical protein